MTNTLNHGNFSCLLLIDGQAARLRDTTVRGDEVEATGYGELSVGSRWTLTWSTWRNGTSEEGRHSTASLAVSGSHVGSWCFEPNADAHPTVQGVFGDSSTQPLVLQLLVRIQPPPTTDPSSETATPFQPEEVKFIYSVFPTSALIALSSPHPLYTTVAPQQTFVPPVPETHYPSTSSKPATRSSTRDPRPPSSFPSQQAVPSRSQTTLRVVHPFVGLSEHEVHNRLADATILTASLKASLNEARDNVNYFETTVAELYELLPLVQQTQYLQARLATNSLSPAVRLSVALSNRQALMSLEIESQSALEGEMERIKSSLLADTYRREPVGSSSQGG